jgi:hypothetical protein
MEKARVMRVIACQRGIGTRMTRMTRAFSTVELTKGAFPLTVARPPIPDVDPRLEARHLVEWVAGHDLPDDVVRRLEQVFDDLTVEIARLVELVDDLEDQLEAEEKKSAKLEAKLEAVAVLVEEKP